MTTVTSPLAVQFGRFKPSLHVEEGRMLNASGQITATISSRPTGRHLTIKLRCSRRDPDAIRRWPTVPFADATHLFIDTFDGQEIASYEIDRGMLRFDVLASPAAHWTVINLLRYLAGVNQRLTAQAELHVMAHCTRCGAELTDPTSIERGYGPDCFGQATSSRGERALTC